MTTPTKSRTTAWHRPANQWRWAALAICMIAWASVRVDGHCIGELAIGRQSNQGEPVSSDSKPRRVALLVGVSTYQNHEFSDLPGAEPDIEGVARALEQNGFLATDVICLTNRMGARDPRRLPTTSNIRKQLRRLSAELRDDDTVWIALAGHGLQSSPGDYSFCPNDADLSDPDSLIGIQEIYEVLKRSPTGFKLLLVDACRENLATHQATGNTGRSLQNIPEPPPATATFFSCSPGQLAYERIDGKSTHGVFFHAVIRGLQGEAAGADGLLTLPDLERFVKKDVQAYVEKTYASAQHPTIRNNTVGVAPLFENLLVERQLKRVIDSWDRQQRAAAYAQLQEILVQHPDAALILAQQARMLSDDYEDHADPKLLEQAQALADRAVQMAPHRAVAWLARANVRRIQGDHHAMLADCELAVQADPNDKRPYVFRALAHRLLDNNEMMRADAQHATGIPQFYPMEETLLAGFYFWLDEMSTGFEILDDAILIAPDVPMLHFMKGYGLDQVGDHNNAILAYTAALRLDAEDDEVLIRRAVSLAKVGDRPAALADLQAVERLRPQRPDLPTVRQFVQQSSTQQARTQRQRRTTSPKPAVAAPSGRSDTAASSSSSLQGRAQVIAE